MTKAAPRRDNKHRRILYNRQSHVDRRSTRIYSPVTKIHEETLVDSKYIEPYRRQYFCVLIQSDEEGQGGFARVALRSGGLHR